jgi:L-alanine-DL-glutamate epimerase-like enolase superfamily enzyme
MNAKISQVDVSAYTIPTDYPEADGTFEWDSTTIVIAEVHAGGRTGLGFTYGDLAAARLIDRKLAQLILGRDAMATTGCRMAMLHAVRNLGRPGVASHAIAAVDIALWDLKAKLFDVPLISLLGNHRAGIPVYGSGGFTSYSIDQLQTQLLGWAQRGIEMVKIKVGAKPEEDVERVRSARAAIGPKVELFVDANGAYSRKQAAGFADRFAEHGVTWFEEPVSSDDLEGLALMCDHAPDGMDIAAGEYGYDSTYFRRMLEAGAVDVIQADATRATGITGFLEAAALADAFHIPLSSHTAPSIHVHACCAVPAARHLEYFHDHVRIEQMLFDGVLQPINGVLYPDPSRPGLGLEVKRTDAARYAA